MALCSPNNSEEPTIDIPKPKAKAETTPPQTAPIIQPSDMSNGQLQIVIDELIDKIRNGAKLGKKSTSDKRMAVRLATMLLRRQA